MYVMYVHQNVTQASNCVLLRHCAYDCVHVHMKELIRGPKALAAEIEVSERVVYDWMAKRLIPYIKVGRVILFDRGKVLTALNKFERKEASV
jgi:hypothetical protein